MNGAALPPPDASDSHIAPPTFREAFRFWLKRGFISFGGPAGQIAIMQTELVEKRRWISQARFLHAPPRPGGATARDLHWLASTPHARRHRGRHALRLPSMFILWTLSFVYVTYGNVPWVAAIFYGLKPAALAIVAAAVIRIGRKALRNVVMWFIAAAAFVAIFYFQLPFPVVVFGALLVGFPWKTPFLVRTADDSLAEPPHTQPSFGRALRVVAIGLTLWWTPILVAGIWQGWDGTLFREGVFFSKAAVVTFGGAYAVLPYVAQQAVEHYGWLQTGQMMDGLALAETTPGPLIMVLQFVGYLGGWNQPGNLPPFLAATLGAFVTTWATFVPCFLWVLLGAPYIERLRGNAKLSSALSAVTAAVVGVILNLAVWFGWHVIFPTPNAIDWFAVALSAIAFFGLLKWKWNVVAVILASGAAGLIFRIAF